MGNLAILLKPSINEQVGIKFEKFKVPPLVQKSENSFISLVRVVIFPSVHLDLYGLPPVVLKVIGGKPCEKPVLSGTVAKRLGFSVNRNYLVYFEEREIHPEYGLQYNIFKITNVRKKEDILLLKEMLNN